MKFILLAILLTPLSSIAGWKYSDKKKPDESIEIITASGEALKSYLWFPKDYAPNDKYKAVVMVHGCGGAYYKNQPEKWTAKYLSGKYKVWGKLLNEKNIIVLLVDSFSSRDVENDIGGGVCNYSADPLSRPAKIDPISVRPVDIAAGISYLKSRGDVKPNQIGVLGFSNGGTSALALSNHENLNIRSNQLMDLGKTWFNLPFHEEYKANLIIAMYPGCGLNGYSWETQNTFTQFNTYTETIIFSASNDTSLPINTNDKCKALRLLDANTSHNSQNMSVKVIENTNHQFDYKENKEYPVQKTIQRILALFESM